MYTALSVCNSVVREVVEKLCLPRVAGNVIVSVLSAVLLTPTSLSIVVAGSGSLTAVGPAVEGVAAARILVPVEAAGTLVSELVE